MASRSWFPTGRVGAGARCTSTDPLGRTNGTAIQDVHEPYANHGVEDRDLPSASPEGAVINSQPHIVANTLTNTDGDINCPPHVCVAPFNSTAISNGPSGRTNSTPLDRPSIACATNSHPRSPAGQVAPDMAEAASRHISGAGSSPGHAIDGLKFDRTPSLPDDHCTVLDAGPILCTGAPEACATNHCNAIPHVDASGPTRARPTRERTISHSINRPSATSHSCTTVDEDAITTQQTHGDSRIQGSMGSNIARKNTTPDHAFVYDAASRSWLPTGRASVGVHCTSTYLPECADGAAIGDAHQPCTRRGVEGRDRLSNLREDTAIESRPAITASPLVNADEQTISPPYVRPTSLNPNANYDGSPGEVNSTLLGYHTTNPHSRTPTDQYVSNMNSRQPETLHYNGKAAGQCTGEADLGLIDPGGHVASVHYDAPPLPADHHPSPETPQSGGPARRVEDFNGAQTKPLIARTPDCQITESKSGSHVAHGLQGGHLLDSLVEDTLPTPSNDGEIIETHAVPGSYAVPHHISSWAMPSSTKCAIDNVLSLNHSPSCANIDANSVSAGTGQSIPLSLLLSVLRPHTGSSAREGYHIDAELLAHDASGDPSLDTNRSARMHTPCNTTDTSMITETTRPSATPLRNNT